MYKRFYFYCKITLLRLIHLSILRLLYKISFITFFYLAHNRFRLRILFQLQCIRVMKFILNGTLFHTKITIHDVA